MRPTCALSEAIRILRPARVVEIGVASGASSAVMLHAMRAHAIDGRIDAFDIHHQCYWDRSRAVGSAVEEMVPDMADRFTLHKGDSRLARETLAHGSIDLAFIDGDHAHPSATLDLLNLAPLLRPGAWVLLHDVLLDKILREREPGTERRSYGPAVLLEHWAGVKTQPLGSVGDVVRGTSAANVAALRVDDPARIDAAFLDAALAVEHEPGAAPTPHTQAA
ncbi:MAG: class I SAM-dependent methyltransferase [Phycisphaerales bacterium]|nr:class I SAM-dependent methyltransferase [Phycisphaerales bacterium]